MLLELEQKKTWGHKDFLSHCSVSVSQLRIRLVNWFLLLTKPLALHVELFCPVVYECDAWVPLLTKVFCFSDKEFFISFEFYLFLFFFFFLSVWLSPRTLHSSFSEQPRKNRVSVKLRLGVGVGVVFSSSFFFSNRFVFLILISFSF